MTPHGPEPASLTGRTLSRYEIAERIGSGGMGEVYLARDQALHRTVAIKVLPAGLAADSVALKRLLREARAASAVNHANVAHVYEIAEAEGVHFIAMEYVEGRTLASLLEDGPLPLARALEIARQVADALEAAHARGIVHRDVKASNIVITPRGQPKVLDFGLARQAGPTDLRADAETITTTGAGLVVGTVPYMSPEQAMGLPVTDRSDVFSLGVVLYEMLAGRRPFRGPSTTAVLDQILHADPEPPSRANPAVSPQLDALVAACLQKAPESRPTAAAVRDDLGRAGGLGSGPVTEATGGPVVARLRRRPSPRVIVAAAVAAGLAVGAASFARWSAMARVDSLAVLPFANSSGDRAMEYLADGITAGLIQRLGRIDDLRVMARDTVQRFKRDRPDAQTLGARLGVRVVVLGVVGKRDDRLSVEVEVVDTRDGRHMWGRRYERDAADLLLLEEEISEEVAEQLRRRLSETDREKLARHSTASGAAYDLYLRGRYYWNRFTEEGFLAAIDHFDQAIEKDPRYALAYAGLADSYILLGVDGHRPPLELMARAEAAARKAVELDPGLSAAHTSLGMFHVFYGWDWAAAEAEFREALRLDPRSGDARHYYSHYLQAVGRTEDAVGEMRKGLESDPLSLILNAELGYAQLCAGRPDAPIAQLKRTLDMSRRFPLTPWFLAQAYEERGMHDEALRTAEPFRAKGAPPFLKSERACAYARAGRPDDARAVLAELGAESVGRFLDPGLLVPVHAFLGDRDAAFREMDRMIAVRSSWVVWLKSDPKFGPLRSDPRFSEALRRVGLTN
ncbi:MAG TPA: protein kinase [Vicinamibacteria bacterium]|nr:protein kinase [Vicinamibacteria bacterium]